VRRVAPRAFTLIEALLGVAIAGIVVGLVFHMFAKGNTTSAKATWRVHAQGAQRNAIRVLKSALEASSYPTVIRVGTLREQVPGYRLRFGDTAGVGAVGGTTMTSFVFTQADWLAKFYRCHPMEDVERVDDGSVGATPPGTCVGVALQLVPGTNRFGRFELWMEEATADVTFDAATGQPLLGAFGPHRRTKLVPDVESVTFTVPNTTAGGFLAPGFVAEIEVVCRDPVDGRMRLAESCRTEVNVEAEIAPVAFEAGPADPGF
jgi:type II secretory pathway pseudopilin PulG